MTQFLVPAKPYGRHGSPDHLFSLGGYSGVSRIPEEFKKNPLTASLLQQLESCLYCEKNTLHKRASLDCKKWTCTRCKRMPGARET